MALPLLLAVAAAATVCVVTATAATPPNFIFVLADDLDWDFKQDRLAIMPNLAKRIAGAGAHFVNHVAAQPVCGPSRTSMLQGRYPHNVGYKANLDQPSVSAYAKVANNTIGTWFTAAGYHTAYLGKYVLARTEGGM
jgi:arylsulfatase A-like enzyme